MFNVISGYVAFRSGKYWIGVIEGNIYCSKRRLTVDKALSDAKTAWNRRVSE